MCSSWEFSNASDVSSTTSSPLPLEENNPNSGNIPGKTSEVHKPSNMVASSSSEVPQHVNVGWELSVLFDLLKPPCA